MNVEGEQFNLVDFKSYVEDVAGQVDNLARSDGEQSTISLGPESTGVTLEGSEPSPSIQPVTQETRPVVSTEQPVSTTNAGGLMDTRGVGIFKTLEPYEGAY